MVPLYESFWRILNRLFVTQPPTQNSACSIWQLVVALWLNLKCFNVWSLASHDRNWAVLSLTIPQLRSTHCNLPKGVNCVTARLSHLIPHSHLRTHTSLMASQLHTGGGNHHKRCYPGTNTGLGNVSVNLWCIGMIAQEGVLNPSATSLP